MKETKHTGGLMEFSYPKGYKPKWNEADNMRRKSIKEYYEKEDRNKKITNHILVIAIIVIIFIFLILKFNKII